VCIYMDVMEERYNALQKRVENLCKLVDNLEPSDDHGKCIIRGICWDIKHWSITEDFLKILRECGHDARLTDGDDEELEDTVMNGRFSSCTSGIYLRCAVLHEIVDREYTVGVPHTSNYFYVLA
jgi:hypothetical protein